MDEKKYRKSGFHVCGVVKQFALDMREAFPAATGFSFSNVKYMKQWYSFYARDEKSQRAIGQFAKSQQAVGKIEMPEIFDRVPWGQHIDIISKCASVEEALFYTDKVALEGWSRPVLNVQFMPEFAGKLNFYVTAADELLRGEGDNPSVGIIICKTAKQTVVEWSLKGIQKPLGVATYQIEQIVERTVKELELHKKEKNEK